MKDHFFQIRPVENNEDDLLLLVQFCQKLAAFDAYKANMDVEKLKKNLFHPKTNICAFFGIRHGEAIGFILAYECFTVYQGERGLYVPGTFIEEKYRHLGYGVKLFRHLSQYALDNDYEFMNWIVEAGNEKANAIYHKMGAQLSEGWSYVRVPKDKIQQIAKKKYDKVTR